MKLKILTHEKYLGRGCDVPRYVHAGLTGNSASKIKPCSFTTREEDGLNRVTYHESNQLSSLEEFAASPTAPCIYSITSSPNDSAANLIALHLVSIFMEGTPGNYPAFWMSLSSGAFDKTVFSAAPKLVVVSSVSPITSNSKLEVVQSVIDRFGGKIPVLVVGTGMDPIAMFATKLYRRPTDLFYFQTTLVKRSVEVI